MHVVEFLGVVAADAVSLPAPAPAVVGEGFDHAAVRFDGIGAGCGDLAGEDALACTERPPSVKTGGETHGVRVVIRPALRVVGGVDVDGAAPGMAHGV